MPIGSPRRKMDGVAGLERVRGEDGHFLLITDSSADQIQTMGKFSVPVDDTTLLKAYNIQSLEPRCVDG